MALLAVTGAAVLHAAESAPEPREHKPLPAEFYGRAGDLYLEYELYEDAAKAFEMALKTALPQGSIDEISRYSDGLIRAFEMLKQMDKAAEILADAGGGAVQPRVKAKLLERACWVYDAAGNAEKFRQTLEQALAALSDVTDSRPDPEAAAQKVQLLRLLASSCSANPQEVERATEALIEAINLTPEFGSRQELRRELAMVYQATNQGPDRLAELETQVRQNLYDEWALEQLAATYSLTPEHGEKAAACYDKLWQRHRNEPAIGEAIAKMYADMGRHDKALQVYAQLQESNPEKRLEYGYCIAWQYLMLGEKGSAVKTVEELFKSVEPESERLSEVAQMLERLGLNDAAAEQLRKAVQVEGSPLKDTYELRLARVLARIGAKDEAKAICERLAQTTAQENIRNEAKQLLEQLSNTGAPKQ